MNQTGSEAMRVGRWLQEDGEIEALLRSARRIAVVGISDKPERDSYRVALYLKDHGYEVIPVNPRLEAWLGIPAVPHLQAIDGPVDIVDVFRRSEETPPIAEQAVAIGARALWLQLGIHHDEAVRIATAGGLDVVTNRCIKIEHGRLILGR